MRSSPAGRTAAFTLGPAVAWLQQQPWCLQPFREAGAAERFPTVLKYTSSPSVSLQIHDHGEVVLGLNLPRHLTRSEEAM